MPVGDYRHLFILLIDLFRLTRFSSLLGTPVNADLTNTADKLMLVDTGAAGSFRPTLGKLAAALETADYQPGQVDQIYITRLYPDHVGGSMARDKLASKNAVVRAEKHDADFWPS